MPGASGSSFFVAARAKGLLASPVNAMAVPVSFRKSRRANSGVERWLEFISPFGTGLDRERFPVFVGQSNSKSSLRERGDSAGTKRSPILGSWSHLQIADFRD